MILNECIWRCNYKQRYEVEEAVTDLFSLGQKSLRMVTAVMKLNDADPGRKAVTKLDSK